MTTVFTNGCFDLLHVGHVRLLAFARSLGDRLIVGLNSDASVRRLKGRERPWVPQAERRELLLALRWVDEVVVFAEDTPLRLLTELRPEVLVKGPDYHGCRCVGADFVESNGGRVVIPDWPRDHSTTRLIDRVGAVEKLGEFPAGQGGGEVLSCCGLESYAEAAANSGLNQDVKLFPRSLTDCGESNIATPETTFAMSLSPIRLAFLDRDGTINIDHGYVHRIEDWEFLPGAVDGLRQLQLAGYKLAVISNQSGIARGKFTTAEVELLHTHVRQLLAREGITLTAVSFCPHTAQVGCGCRKPATGLASAVASSIGGPVDLTASWTIGDKPSDIEMGHRLGTRTALLRSRYWSDADQVMADLIADSLCDAARSICQRIAVDHYDS